MKEIIETIKAVLFIVIIIFTFCSSIYMMWILLNKMGLDYISQSFSFIIVTILYIYITTFIAKKTKKTS